MEAGPSVPWKLEDRTCLLGSEDVNIEGLDDDTGTVEIMAF
jgi:hypothetical protein